ncbi:MAG: RNA polymerase [Thalassobius sp.]|nr:RNA polymerase [Thalassovita sp.]
MKAQLEKEMLILLEKCMQGNRQAQYEVYQQYSKAMFNICFRILNNYEEAEDVLQESFVSAFRNLSSFKGDATFGAWLKRIVINHAINAIRKKKQSLVSIDEHPVDIPEPDSGKNTDENDIKFNVEKIRKAMELLPEGYRIVFSLYLLEGYDHSEIGEILGISESTSKSQLNRAKKKLKAIMAQY